MDRLDEINTEPKDQIADHKELEDIAAYGIEGPLYLV
jgi:hypothetical protein